MTNNTHIRYALSEDTFGVRLGRNEHAIDVFHKGISTDAPFADSELIAVYDSRDEALAALAEHRTSARSLSGYADSRLLCGTEYCVEAQEVNEDGDVIAANMWWFSQLHDVDRERLEAAKAREAFRSFFGK